MSRDHGKYNREQIIKRDRKQLRLDTLTPMKNPMLKDEVLLEMGKKGMCPFCLFSASLERFAFSTHKSGFHKGLGHCINCGNKSTWRNLLLIPTMTPQQYAVFVFFYGRFFWQKIEFKKWKESLYDKGIEFEFWDKYKKLKGEKNYELE